VSQKLEVGSETVDAFQRPDRYPLSSRYDSSWVISLDMGPHPLWQLEDLLPDLALEAGMRVPDLGADRGATSVFLARECDVEVVAVDFWVPAERARAVYEAAGVAAQVTAVHGDIRTVQIDGVFDAIVSIDAFEYFGTDVQLLPRVLKYLCPGGRLGISTPG
jgi:cyclopropane fatty-acyl-phospholipid synthase-like methyltransferase